MGYWLQVPDLSRERERQRSAGAFARCLAAEFDEAPMVGDAAVCLLPFAPMRYSPVDLMGWAAKRT